MLIQDRHKVQAMLFTHGFRKARANPTVRINQVKNKKITVCDPVLVLLDLWADTFALNRNPFMIADHVLQNVLDLVLIGHSPVRRAVVITKPEIA